MNSFFINKRIENEEFLMQSELMANYEFHKIKDEQSQMMRVGDYIVILDSNFRFIKLQIKYDQNTDFKYDKFKITIGDSQELNMIKNSFESYKDAQKGNFMQNKRKFKLIDSSQNSSNFVFILTGKKIFKVNLDNPLQRNDQVSQLYYFQDKENIDDIIFYSFEDEQGYRQSYFLIVSQGSIFIYNYDRNQIKFTEKMKGLKKDQLNITMTVLYNDILLLVDQRTGIFFYGLPNGKNRKDFQRLPLYIEASDVIDVFVSEKSIIAVESEESNSVRVIITEYYYAIENSIVFEVKELIERYTNYQKGYLSSQHFYFISNFALHYITLQQNFSKSPKALSSIFSQDDFSFSQDKILTNSESVRIHNFFIIEAYQNFSQTLFVGLENKRINLFALEQTAPSIEIKFNSQQDNDDIDADDQQKQQGHNNNDFQPNSDIDSYNPNDVDVEQEGTDENQQNEQKQVTTICAVFDCSEFEKFIIDQQMNGVISKDQVEILSKVYDEHEVSVYKDFCLITTQIDFTLKEKQSWIINLLFNKFFYYGLLGSLLSIPLSYLIVRILFQLEIKNKIFNLIKEKLKLKIRSDEKNNLITKKENDKVYKSDSEKNQNFIEMQTKNEQNELNQDQKNQTDMKRKIFSRTKQKGVQSSVYQQVDQNQNHKYRASDTKRINNSNQVDFLKEKVKPNIYLKQNKGKVFSDFNKQQFTRKQKSPKFSQIQIKEMSTLPQKMQNQATANLDNENLRTEVVFTENLKTETDEHQFFKVTKLNHDE